MSPSWRIVAAAALSLVGVAGTAVVANATPNPEIDCFYQVTAAGNGQSSYLTR